MDEAGDAGQKGEEQDGAEQDYADQDGAGQERGKGAAILPLLIVGLIGLGGGGAIGGKALGARVGEELARRQLEGGGRGNGGEGESALHIIDNLVVNPAASTGTRFLLVSIAIQLNSPEDAEVFQAWDVELRDTLIMVLGTKTVEELADITLRRGIAREIRQAIERISGPGMIHEVFIPQFVIQ